MKNVCFFNSVKFWGGGEKHHLEYAVEFKNKNYHTILLAHKNSPLAMKVRKHNIEVFPVSVSNLSFLNPFKVIRLIRFYRKHQVDTVVFSVSQDLKLGGIAAKLARVENIVYLRVLDIPIKNKLINRFLFSSVLTHIITNSQETRRSALKHLGKYIPPEKVKTIYPGLDIGEKSRKEHKLPAITSNAKGIILGNAGRLTPQKGQQHLIEIAKKLKDRNIEFTLYIAGTGEMQAELEALIKKYNLQEEVILLGFVQDMDGFMNSIDIFLLTSMWEGFGFVLAEAMIKGKPAVGFNISSNPEVVLNNKTGFLVEYPNLEEFANKTEQLIRNEQLRKQMGEAGKQSVIDRFDLVERVTEFEQVLLAKDI